MKDTSNKDKKMVKELTSQTMEPNTRAPMLKDSEMGMELSSTETTQSLTRDR